MNTINFKTKNFDKKVFVQKNNYFSRIGKFLILLDLRNYLLHIANRLKS